MTTHLICDACEKGISTTLEDGEDYVITESILVFQEDIVPISNVTKKTKHYHMKCAKLYNLT